VRNLFAGYGKVDANGMPAVPVLADVSLTCIADRRSASSANRDRARRRWRA
jgi:hypothetical protein